MAKANDTKQFEAFMAPVMEFNKLVVKNAESAFNMQFASMQAYADLGLKNLNAGLEVRNADDLKTYAEKQKDVVQEITARAAADAKAFGELNTQFVNDTRSLAEKNMKAADMVASKAA